MKIVIDNKIPFIKGVLEPFADCLYLPAENITNNTVKEADALVVRTRTKCNEILLNESKVKFIASATIGFDHIDVEYCMKKNIQWINSPGCNSSSVMQYVALALLQTAIDKHIDLKERTLGVVGVGNVGEKVVKLAEILGMRVLLCDPPRVRTEGACSFITLKTMLKEVDILTFHTPLNLEGEYKTYHLFNDELLNNIIPGTIIINTSRGEVIKTESLLRGIKRKVVESAIIDVWENEPGINAELFKNVHIGTPHIAGYSADGKANATSMCVQAISKFFGFEYDNWEVEDIPKPKNDIIEIDGKDKTFQQVLLEVLKVTYDINHDHLNLHNNLRNFETLRGNYYVRREPCAYRVNAKNVNDETMKSLARLRFNLL